MSFVHLWEYWFFLMICFSSDQLGYHFSFRGHGLYCLPKTQHRWRPFRPLHVRKQRFLYHVYHRLKRAVHWLADVIPGRQSKHYFRSSRLPWSHSRWRCVKFLSCTSPVLAAAIFLPSCPAVLSPSSCRPVLLSWPHLPAVLSCCPVSVLFLSCLRPVPVLFVLSLFCLRLFAVLSPSCLHLPAVLSPSCCCPVSVFLLSCLRPVAVLSPSSCCPVFVFWLSCPADLSCCPVSVFLLSWLRPVPVLSPSSCCPVSVFLFSCLRPVAVLSPTCRALS